MQIKVLGSGCANCHTLGDRTTQALDEIGAEGTVEMVTDFGQIAAYGVMSTPALVIDETVVLTGRVPEVTELVSILSR